MSVVKLVFAHPTEPKHLVRTPAWDGDVDLEDLGPLIARARDEIKADVAVLRVYPPVDGETTVLLLPVGDGSLSNGSLDDADWRAGEVTPVGPAWSTKPFRGEILDWASGFLGPIEDLQQVRIWDLSWVARTNDAYIKATGISPLFADEGGVTAALAGLFPDRVAKPIAYDTERRWMILPDLGPGRRLKTDKPEYERFLRDFARMQIESAGHVDVLLASGCVERSLDWTRDHGRDWLGRADLSGLRPADSDRARQLVDDLPGHIDRLNALGLPNTLLHGDIHSGNTIGNGDAFWYIDWTDASIGHPFVDMFTIRLIEGRRGDELREAYLDEWRAAGFAHVDESWDAAGVVLAAHHAISYIALCSEIVPPVEQDLLDMIPTWLARMVDAAGGLPMRELA